MKICSTCKEEKELSEFNRNKSKKDGYSYSCKVCKKKHQKRWYERHKDEQYVRIRDRRGSIKSYNIKMIYDYLLANPCVDCGEADPIVLEFDHVKGIKSFTISNYIYSKPWEVIKLEIEKCVVRCRNCHIRKTSKDFNYWKQNYTGL
jgi:hypothetical protein